MLPVKFPSLSWGASTATVSDTGMAVSWPPLVATMAPSYIPAGVPAGTASVASNEPLAEAGVVSQPQSWLS